MGIFKAYDIRGVVPTELHEDLAYKIGLAFSNFLKGQGVVVSNDMRVSAQPLREATIRGLRDGGSDVVYIGMCSTPMNYYASGKFNLAGMQITASHNPGKYNGYKLSREQAIPISGETGIKDVEKMVQTGDLRKAAKQGAYSEKNILADYKKHVLSFVKNIKPLKCVVDTGNGIVGNYFMEVFGGLGLHITPLFFEPDGNFPNHEANPIKEENMRDLQQKVRELKADIGIAFDGDGDRVAFVDEKAEIVSSDMIGALVAKEILAKYPKSSIVYDLRSSHSLPEFIQSHGGHPIETRVGHSFMKAIMRENDSSFGGELSGHYYFKDNYTADSGEIALITMLNLLSRENKPLSALIAPLKKYFATGEINFEVEDKEGKIKLLAERFKDAKVYYLDGISIVYPEWWCNVRMSNTEPVLRLNLEANTAQLRDKRASEIKNLLAGK